MVDEYQDTNTIQDRILNLIAGDNPNLCVVGDDDQGLYRFRGATIRNILQFKDKFPDNNCQQVELTVNYRSHPEIIHFYNRWMREPDWVIKNQSYRYDKQIKPRGADFPDVPRVMKASGLSKVDWHEEVLAFLLE
ncbi:ATP-dependent DNA helicase UvrD/PcrA (plasmid) [Geminocystis sp. NIES-3708]|nr:ATP-dependent DNA helicase UvrD/PcrA [Geminocystis sp. NIES-3708]